MNAERIDSLRACGPSKQSENRTLGPSIPALNKSFIVEPRLFLSTPNVVAIFPFGSKSMSKTRRAAIPSSSLPTARAEAMLTAVVVFPQPPL